MPADAPVTSAVLSELSVMGWIIRLDREERLRTFLPPCGAARCLTHSRGTELLPTSRALLERLDESSKVCGFRGVHSLDELSVPRCKLVHVRTGVLKLGFWVISHTWNAWPTRCVFAARTPGLP